MTESTIKSILITGCSSGIGLCAAQTLHTKGYQVFAAVRKPEDKARLQQLGLYSLLLDVNDPQSIRAGVAEVLAQTNGSIDALFNNAGFGQPGAVEDLSREALRAQFETNVFGLQELTNQIIPLMRKQGYGRIVNVSSVLGLVSMAYRGAYCATKYAVEALTDAMRLELRNTGIHVALIEPGPISSRFRYNARQAYGQHVDSMNSTHRVPYANLEQYFEEVKENTPFTLPPDAVVKKLLHALESNRPKIRYPVTVVTYFLSACKRVLTSRWLDALLLKIAKHETKT